MISEPSGSVKHAGLQKRNRPKDFSWTEQWYPIIPECNAPLDKPFPFALFDGSYLLIRSESGWSVLEERCLLDRSPLSEYRPVQDSATSETNSGLRKYQAKVQHKIIWVFLGPPERSSSASIFVPEDTNDMKAISDIFMRDIPCGFETLVENLADEGTVRAFTWQPSETDN